MRGGVVRKSYWEEIPDNIVEGNKILSYNLFAEFLKEQMKDKGLKCKKAAYVIPDSDIFVRKVSMPKLEEEQLRDNIPFEFKDFIQGELNQYVFDYVKRSNDNEEEATTVELLAYAVPLVLIKPCPFSKIQTLLQVDILGQGENHCGRWVVGVSHDALFLDGEAQADLKEWG